MHDIDKAICTLKAFRDMGVRLAIDNFGTGYSSLANLRKFPVDTIKIDGSLIRDLSNQAENGSIAEATIAVGSRAHCAQQAGPSVPARESAASSYPSCSRQKRHRACRE